MDIDCGCSEYRVILTWNKIVQTLIWLQVHDTTFFFAMSVVTIGV